MAQKMSGTSARSCNTRSGERSVDDHRDGTVRAESAKGRAATDKDSVSFSSGAAKFEVLHERTPYLVSQWQSGMLPSLATDMNPRPFPVDVGQSELKNV